MDPILAEIYSTVFAAAPYVIGAYLLMWLVLFTYVLIVVGGLKRTERRMAALEEALALQQTVPQTVPQVVPQQQDTP